MKYSIEVQDLKTNSHRFIFDCNLLELFYYLWKYDMNKDKKLKITKRRRTRK